MYIGSTFAQRTDKLCFYKPKLPTSTRNACATLLASVGKYITIVPIITFKL